MSNLRTSIIAALSLVLAASPSIAAAPAALVVAPSQQQVGFGLALGSIGTDICKTNGAFGLSNTAFAASFGVGITDENCVRLKNARMLYEMGLNEAAVQVLCDDPKIAAAMKRANTPCEKQKREDKKDVQ